MGRLSDKRRGGHTGMGHCSLHQGRSRTAPAQEGSCASGELAVLGCTETGSRNLVWCPIFSTHSTGCEPGEAQLAGLEIED